MDSAPADNTLSAYYLKIQALTPVDEVAAAPAPAVAPPTPLQIPTVSIVIFLAVLIVGAFTLLITKTRQINKMLVLLVVAFVSSALPLTMKSLSQQATYRSHAGPTLAPKNVTVTEVTSSGFSIAWDTDKPDIGALRCGPLPQMGREARIYSEGTDNPLTAHRLTVTGLKKGTTYYCHVLAGSAWFNDGGQPLRITISPTP